MCLNCLAWGTQISRGKLKIVYRFQCWRLLRHENDIKICAVKKKAQNLQGIKGKANTKGNRETHTETRTQRQTHSHRHTLSR